MPESFEKQTLKTIVDLLSVMRDNDNRNFDRVTASIDALALNIAQLAAQQKQTSANLEKWGERTEKSIDRLTEAIRETNQAINGHLAVAQQQSANIEALTRLATVLVSRTAYFAKFPSIPTKFLKP
ncbi:hypothetical protein NC981_00725 [Leptolyngbya sp. DQ-M1]|uniref:hypothetical protein n=1 Tax=Leptolyngbya sp. DQ-M1 TaxID=2933920 RepID=UPI0032976460